MRIPDPALHAKPGRVLCLWLVAVAACGGGESGLPSDGGADATRPDGDASTPGTGNLVWVKAAGGVSRDETKAIAALPDGTFFVAGEIDSQAAVFGAGETNETTLSATAGSADVLLARYDGGGSLIWARRVGGGPSGGDDEGLAVAAFADGSSVIAGLFEASCTFGPGTPNETTFTGGGNEIFLARHDDAGNLVWAKHVIGTQDDERATAISGFTDGSFVVAGTMFGPGARTFGPGEANETVVNQSAERTVFLARYETDGTLAWVRPLSVDPVVGESSAAIFDATAVALPDGNVLLASRLDGQSTFGAGEANETVLSSVGFTGEIGVVAKYSGDGTLVWARRVATGIFGLALAGMADGAFAITGSFDAPSSSTFGEGAAAVRLDGDGLDVFVARFDADGNVSWAHRATGPDNDFSEGIAAQSDGTSIYITGHFGTNSMFPGLTFAEDEAVPTTLTSVGQAEIFIASYDGAGHLRWAKSAGGTGRDDEGHALAVLADGSTMVTGLFGGLSQAATFGKGEANETVLTPTGTDIFVARFEP